jgi:hypothetical protein
MPRLSAEKRKKLEKPAARPDREIDLSDIPEFREIPSDYVIGKFYRPKKETVTIRIDSDFHCGKEDDTEWAVKDFYHIYYCPFCGDSIKGQGWGEYDKKTLARQKEK